MATCSVGSSVQQLFRLNGGQNGGLILRPATGAHSALYHSQPVAFVLVLVRKADGAFRK